MAGGAEIEKMGPFPIEQGLINNIKNPEFLSREGKFGFIKTLKFPKDRIGNETVEKKVLIILPKLPSGVTIDFENAKVGSDGYTLNVPIILHGKEIEKVNVNPYEITLDQYISLKARPRIIDDN